MSDADTKHFFVTWCFNNYFYSSSCFRCGPELGSGINTVGCLECPQ